METKQNQAVMIFDNNYNCAQSVLSVFADNLGLHKDIAFKLANNFGAGIAYTQQTCGAVTGALMAIGLKYGKGENGTNDDKEMANDMATYFITEFKKKHGSTQCLALLENINFTTPEGAEMAHQRNIFNTHCPEFIKTAVALTEKIINR
jgi:C_GCAxxG_C_C family probable redox protein